MITNYVQFTDCYSTARAKVPDSFHSVDKAAKPSEWKRKLLVDACSSVPVHEGGVHEDGS